MGLLVDSQQHYPDLGIVGSWFWLVEFKGQQNSDLKLFFRNVLSVGYRALFSWFEIWSKYNGGLESFILLQVGHIYEIIQLYYITYYNKLYYITYYNIKDACDVTLSVNPHLWEAWKICLATKNSWLLDYIDIEETRLSSEI